MWLQEDSLIVNEDGPNMLLPTHLFCFFLYFLGVSLCSKVSLFESDPFGSLVFVLFGFFKIKVRKYYCTISIIKKMDFWKAFCNECPGRSRKAHTTDQSWRLSSSTCTCAIFLNNTYQKNTFFLLLSCNGSPRSLPQSY